MSTALRLALAIASATLEEANKKIERLLRERDEARAQLTECRAAKCRASESSPVGADKE